MHRLYTVYWRPAGHSTDVAEASLSFDRVSLHSWTDYKRPTVPLALLTFVYTQQKWRRMGLGKRVVADAIRLADEQGWDLVTYASPFSGGEKMTESQLESFYKTMGFSEVRAGSGDLVRRVRTSG